MTGAAECGTRMPAIGPHMDHSSEPASYNNLLLEGSRTVGPDDPEPKRRADIVGHECVTCDRFYFPGEDFSVCVSRGHTVRPVYRRRSRRSQEPGAADQEPGDSTQ